MDCVVKVVVAHPETKGETKSKVCTDTQVCLDSTTVVEISISNFFPMTLFPYFVMTSGSFYKSLRF